MTFSPDIQELIDRLAKADKLAVVSDFDGTLAPFAVDRYSVRANEVALQALQDLAERPSTRAAVLSGRDIVGLRRICPLRPPVLFGGSHGAETAPATGGEIVSCVSDEGLAHLRAKEAELHALIKSHPGAEVEVKPFQVVLHVRDLQTRDSAAATAALEAATRLDPGQFPFTMGKSVAEFSATTATKGTWLANFKQDTGATVVFIGDDLTDEDGFAALDYPAGDAGIKVGEGETLGSHRLADVAAVAEFLHALAARR